MAKVSLDKINPGGKPWPASKQKIHDMTEKLQQELYDLLYLMFADSKYSLLVILQGIDSSGKDGSVRHIFSGANPQGIKVVSFKEPTSEECRHDFLWRCHQHTPESGLTTIFNRSYYEEVTTVMVHPEKLKSEHMPDKMRERKDFFNRRYQRINEFEKMLNERGTIIVKFFLHISKDEQKKRLQERLTDRSKNWKFSEADVRERKYWDSYMSSYEKMLNHTHTKHCPWVIVPADHKWYRNFIISRTLVQTLRALPMKFPKSTDADLHIV